MGTRKFNFIDNILAKLRFNAVKQYIEEDDIILDFGCGYQAYLLKNIKNKIKFGIGIDYDIKNDSIGNNIKLQRFRFTDKLTFKSNYFNKIIVTAVIEHLEESLVYSLFKESHRVLKPKGMIILTTPTPISKGLFEFLAFKLKIISQSEIADHKKYYSNNDLLNLAQQTKFTLTHYNTFQFGLNSFVLFNKI